MKAAAGVLGISVDLVKRASEQGCPAFDHGRVHVPELRKFLSDSATATIGDDPSLKEQKLSEEVRKLKLANDYKAGRLVLRSAVCETIQRILGRCRADYERKLRDEYPTAVAGMDVPTARIYGTRIADEITAALGGVAEEWAA